MYNVTRALPTTVSDTVDIGTFNLSIGAASLWVSITVPASSFSTSKQYIIPVNWDETGGTWQTVQPIGDAGAYGTNDYELDINVSSATTQLRIRRSAGSTVGNAYVAIQYDGDVTSTFTESSATASVTPPTAFYSATAIRQLDGRVAIGQASAETTLDVRGGISGATLYVSTSLNGAGLTDCDLATQKMTWDSSTGRFGCATIVAGTNTGNVLQIGDARYVRKAGDTMTGALVLTPTGGSGALALRIVGRQTLTGAAIFAASRAAATPVTIKGYSGQMANLTEWQNSAATLLARIGSGGGLTIGSQAGTSADGHVRVYSPIGGARYIELKAVSDTPQINIGASFGQATQFNLNSAGMIFYNGRIGSDVQSTTTPNYFANLSVGHGSSARALATYGLSVVSGDANVGMFYIDSLSNMNQPLMTVTEASKARFSIRGTGAGGGIGIGTTTPGSALAVSGSVVIGNAISSTAAKAQLDVKGTISGSKLTITSADDALGMTVINNDASPTVGLASFIRTNNLASADPDKAVVYISDHNSSNDYALHIEDTANNAIFSVRSSGQVGIGTTTTARAKLYVAGSGSFAGTMSGKNLFVTGTGSATAPLIATSQGFGRVGIGIASPTSKLHVSGTSTNPAELAIQEVGSSKYSLLAGTYFYLRDDGTTRLVMDDSGNIAVGAALAKSLFDVKGSISGATLYVSSSMSGAGLADCDIANNALQWDSTTERFSCRAIAGTFSTGNVLTIGDARYVRKAGDTMTGNLVIRSVSTSGSGALAVIQTREFATGAYIYSSGTVLALDAYSPTGANKHIMFGYRGNFDTNLYRKSSQTLQTDGSLIVLNKIYGDTIQAGTMLASSGSLVWEGTASGNTLAVSRVASHLIPSADDTWDLGTSALRWQDLYLSGGTLHIGSSALEGQIGYLATGFEGLTFNTDTDATNEVVISSGGYVGIGTAAPNAILTLAKNNNITLDANDGYLAMVGGTSDGGFSPPGGKVVVSGVGRATYGGGVALLASTSGDSPHIDFYVNGGVTPGLRFHQSGNLGIGTTTPKGRLHVVGSGAFTGTISGSALNIQGGTSYIRGNLGIGTISPKATLDVVGTISGSRLVVSQSFASSGTLIVESGAYIDGTTLTVHAGPNRVGIGTATPETKLDVIDDSIDAGIRVRHSNLTAGISIGYNTIKSNGSATDQNINITPAGAGYVQLNGTNTLLSAGAVYSHGNSINGNYSADSNSVLYINYAGYLAGQTQFRDLNIMNGKASNIAFFQGSSGNFGIGTTAPKGRLHVVGSGSFAGTMSGKALYITGTGASTKPVLMTDTSEGRVGIGTNDPNASLAIFTTADDDGIYWYGQTADLRIYKDGDLPTWTSFRATAGSGMHFVGAPDQTGISISSSTSFVGIRKLVAKTQLDVAGVISGSSLYISSSMSGAGLSDCDASTSKLLWDATTERFSCGTVSAGSGGTSTGNVLTIGDARYVRKAGDTMTGALTINVTGGVQNTIGLKVINTLSGAHLHAESRLTVSGSAVIEGRTAAQQQLIVRGAPSQSASLQEWQDSNGNVLFNVNSNGTLNINGGVSSSLITNDTTPLLSRGTSDITLLDHSYWQSFTVKTNGSNRLVVDNTGIEVLGTVSGSTVFANTALRSSGTLVVEGQSTLNGNVGIRTNSPGSALAVSGATIIGRGITSNTPNELLELTANTAGTTTNSANIRFSYSPAPTSYYNSILNMFSGNAYDTEMQFQVVSNGTSFIPLSVTAQNTVQVTGKARMSSGVIIGRTGDNLSTTAALELSQRDAAESPMFMMTLNNDFGRKFTIKTAHHGSTEAENFMSFYVSRAAGTGEMRMLTIGAHGTSVFSGSLVVGTQTYNRTAKANLESMGSVSGSSLLTLSKYSTCTLKTSATGMVICGSDNTGAGGSFSTGNVLTIGDARYVRTAGGTMTGALTINVTGGVQNTIGLKVINTLSGAHLHAESRLTVSGSTVLEGRTASLQPLIVRGAASQSVNLVEYQNSAGTVLSSIGSTGNFAVGMSPITTASVAELSLGSSQAVLPSTNIGFVYTSDPTSFNNRIENAFNATASVNAMEFKITHLGVTTPLLRLQGNKQAVISGSLVLSPTGGAVALRSSGAISIDGSSTFQGTISGSSIVTLSKYSSCNLETTATGMVICGVDESAGSGLDVATADARYVRKSGSTMTGALTIDMTGGVQNTIGLKVINTLSGAHLHAEKTLSSSGTLVAEGATTLNGALTVIGNATFDTNTLFVDASGDRVGVGTASPNSRYKMHIDGTTSSVALGVIGSAVDYQNGLEFGESTSAAGGVYWIASGTKRVQFTSVGHAYPLEFGNNWLYANTNGRIGIGTQSPSTKLHVVGGAATYPDLLLESVAAGNDYGARFVMENSSNEQAIIQYSDVSGGTAHYTEANYLTISTPSGDGIQFNTNGATNNGMRIMSSGNVGIGVTSAKAKLTVAGSGAFTGTLSGSALNIQGGTSYIRGNLGLGTVSPKAKLDVLGNMSGSALMTLSAYRSCTLKTSATGMVICGSDLTGGGSSFSTGNVLTIGDARYLRTAGGTMTGALNIRPTAGSTTVGLNVAATMSGRSLIIIGTGSVTTPMLYTNVSNGRIGIGTSTPKSKVDVNGTISGQLLNIAGPIVSRNNLLATGNRQAYYNFDGTTFDTTNLTRSSASYVYQSGAIVFYHSSSNWGDGVKSNAVFQRSHNIVFEGDITNISNGYAMIGFKDSSASFNYATGSHYVYFVQGGDIQIFENGSSANDPATSWTTGTKYRVRIVAKPIGGAAYYISSDNGASWTTLWAGSTAVTTTAMTFAVSYYSGDWTVDNVEIYSTNAVPSLYANSGSIVEIGSKLGIGTYAPKTKLEVMGTISGALITQNGAGNNYFRGNVGIGTASPSGLLTVAGSAATADVIVSSTSAAASINLASLLAPSSTGDTYLTVGRAHTTGNATLLGHSNVGGGGNTYAFLTTYGRGASDFALTSAGNIGIGTVTPKARLDVQGTMSGASFLTLTRYRSCTLKTSATGMVICGSDNTGAGGSFSTGNVLTIGDARYLRTAGGTMTGQLVINITGGSQSTIGLKIINTLSGAHLHAEQLLTSSGMLIIESSGINGSGAAAFRAFETQTGAYVYGSGAAIMALDSGTARTTTPHIAFGYRGNFDTSITRTHTGSLTFASQTGVLLTLDSEMSVAKQDVFRIFSDYAFNENKVFRITASGSVFADSAYHSSGADYAEWFYAGNQKLTPGEVVCIDVTRNNAVKRCDRDADANIMGIVSSNPAFIGNVLTGADGIMPPGYVLVGLIGQVPAKVIVQSGAAIRPGDSLTAASIPGYARKAMAGESTVGVALEGLEYGEGVVNVLISRRNQSLTVSAVEEEVLKTIADMEIQDEVELMVSQTLGDLNVDQQISDEVQRQIGEMNANDLALESLRAEIELLKTRFAEIRNQSGSTTVYTSTGSYGSTNSLEVNGNLTTGGNARVGGDLAIDGALTASSLFVPNGLQIDGGVVMNGMLETTELTVSSGATINGVLTINGTLNLGETGTLNFGSGTVQMGDLVVENTLFVMGDITIAGLATFLKDVVIEGNLEVKGELILSNKQAGYAMIPQSGTSVTIHFGTGFKATPMVTATPNGYVDGAWWTTTATQTGFTIMLKNPAAEDVQFSWIALSVGAPVTLRAEVNADGTTIFPLDDKNVPVSSNKFWNACIRNITLMDETGQPYSCGRYHDQYTWTHPDLGMTFIWNTSVTPALLKVPDGYLPSITETSASVEAAFLDNGEGHGEDLETPAESSSSSSVESSSSSSAPAAEQPVVTEPTPVESSSSSVSSAASSSAPAVEGPAPEPVVEGPAPEPVVETPVVTDPVPMGPAPAPAETPVTE